MVSGVLSPLSLCLLIAVSQSLSNVTECVYSYVPMLLRINSVYSVVRNSLGLWPLLLSIVPTLIHDTEGSMCQQPTEIGVCLSQWSLAL